MINTTREVHKKAKRGYLSLSYKSLEKASFYIKWMGNKWIGSKENVGKVFQE